MPPVGAEANRLSRNATKSASVRATEHAKEGSPTVPRILPVQRFDALGQRLVGGSQAAQTLTGACQRNAEVATSNAAIRALVPCRTYSNSRRSTCLGFIGRLGAARSSAWMPVISSIETVCTPCPAAVGAA